MSLLDVVIAWLLQRLVCGRVAARVAPAWGRAGGLAWRPECTAPGGGGLAAVAEAALQCGWGGRGRARLIPGSGHSRERSRRPHQWVWRL